MLRLVLLFLFCILLSKKIIEVIIRLYLPAKKKKKKTYEYKFYQSESQSQQAAAVDEHTKNYTEISKYLATPHAASIKDVEQVHGFPAVKNLHKKFNAIMPSEADVERIFSWGSKFYTPFESQSNSFQIGIKYK